MSRDRNVAVRLKLILDGWNQAEQASRNLDSLGQHGQQAGRDTAQGMQEAGQGVERFGTQAQAASRKTSSELDRISGSSLKVSTDVGDMSSAWSLAGDSATIAANDFDFGSEAASRLSEGFAEATIDVGSLEDSMLGAGGAVSDLGGMVNDTVGSFDQFETVTLSASDLEAAMRSAGDASAGAADQSQSAWQKVTQSARDDRQEWTTLGAAITGYGAAVTGVGAAVLAVGINYNQLRQRSVAALTALTGSAEQANAQMDRLDDFASNSPFARDVFIRAQQQMMAFGIEAEDVVPWLERIQDTVAATGGSNDDIAELAGIISRIGSVGKISAEDLNQLGYRGVNAAKLIGDQMGMTEGQIRDSITRGTLDAGTALEALGVGMEQSFGGAASLVKDTLDGAFDRVKAAVRDFGAFLAEPLVSADGGGLLLDLLNGIADALRWFEQMPDPFRNIIVGLGLLTGPLALAAGGFLLLGPRVIDTYDSLKRLNGDLPLLQGRMGTFARGLGRLTAGMTALAIAIPVAGAIDDALSTDVDVDKLTLQLRGLADVSTFASSEIQAVGTSFTDALFMRDLDTGADQLERLGDSFRYAFGQGAVTRLERGMSNVSQIIPGVSSAFDSAVEDISAFDQALTQMATSGHIEKAGEAFAMLYEAASRDVPELSITQMLSTMPEYEKQLRATAVEMDLTQSEAVLLALALGDIPAAVEASENAFSKQIFAPVTEELARLAPEVERSADAVVGFGTKFGSAIYSAQGRVHREALAELRAEFGELVGGVAESVGRIQDFDAAFRAATEATDDGAFSLAAYRDELAKMAEAQANFESNLLTIQRLWGADAADWAQMQPPELVQAIIDDFNENGGQISDDIFGYVSEGGERGAAAFSEKLLLEAAAMNLAAEVFDDEAARELGRELHAGTTTAVEAIRSDPSLRLALETLALTDPAYAELLRLVEVAEAQDPQVPLGLDAYEAEMARQGFYDETEEMDPHAKLWLEVSEAEAARLGFVGDVESSDPVIDLYANDRNAIMAAESADRRVRGLDPVIDMYGNNRSALQQAESADRAIRGMNPSMQIGGDTTRANSSRVNLAEVVRRTTANITIGARTGAALGAAAAAVSRINNMSATVRVTSTGGLGSALRRAGGGPVVGPGTGTSDSVPLLASNGEWVMTDRAVKGAGGFAAMSSLMSRLESGLPAYAAAGPVSPQYAQRSPVPAPVVVQAPAAAAGVGRSVTQHITVYNPVQEPATRSTQRASDHYVADASL